MLVALTATTLWKVAFELLYLFGLFDFSIVTAITIANTPLAITMVAVAIIVNWFNH